VSFPSFLSFTITNKCNLRCRMCGQWSEEGYLRAGGERRTPELELADWKRLVDEAAAHHASSVLLRGGEPFLFPGIIELLEYIRSRGIFTSIDTNGTMLGRCAADLLRIGQIHVTVSVDGPEEIHDSVRGVKGCFRRIREGLERLGELERQTGRRISKSLNFTISGDSYRGLGAMPDIARSLSVGTLSIVPYYYVPESVGRRYENEMAENLGCRAYSWRGFHRESSGVDFDVFRGQLEAYRQSLGGLYDYPYMKFSPEEYRVWFRDAVTPVGPPACANVENLIDIQPSGDANFCVDFPDYSIGNVRNATIEELWDSPAAERFRRYRRQQPFAVCHRCGAKYMGEVRSR
jgi:MoaA/NifB/PqqE/SkfB family radical SAM enzyme